MILTTMRATMMDRTSMPITRTDPKPKQMGTTMYKRLKGWCIMVVQVD